MKNKTGSPYQQELIGSYVSVVDSKHRGYLRIKGKIVDETMKTLLVNCKGVSKIIPKKGNIFSAEMKNGTETLVGDRLMFRPEDRIKRLG